jgi:hypothetical protein
MIVFTKQEKKENPVNYIAGLNTLLDRVEKGPTAHEDCVELLMEWGELETGISDMLFMESDSIEPLAVFSRQIATLIGRVFYLSWAGETGRFRTLIPEIRAKLLDFSMRPLPNPIRTRAPEGYIYYGLYPEMYLEAAGLFAREIKPERAVSIGLRSIGTSLSAAVSGALIEQCIKVESFTLRPRGHPFRRKILISPDMEDRLKSLSGGYFLIVDEGPGISGTSFGAASRALREIGIPPEKIIFFPSHIPESSRLLTSYAREEWEGPKKYFVSFEESEIRDKILGRKYGHPDDISAGRWRRLFFDNDRHYPALHPNHEQRKYLCGEAPCLNIKGPHNGKKVFKKFLGLGKYGREKYKRAQSLAEAGLYPEVKELENGFLSREFVEGRPAARSDLSRELLDFMAGYIARVGKTFPAEGNGLIDSNVDKNLQMINENVLETLGKEWTKDLGRLEKLRPVLSGTPPCAIDGRMMRHEWLVTPEGFLKTDSVGHHADQFYPRSQDPAWDVAALSIEFPLRGEEKEYFITRYGALFGDSRVKEKMPFYSVAYLAYRLGYVELASMELGSMPDGLRLKSLSDYYSFLLKMELSRLAL